MLDGFNLKILYYCINKHLVKEKTSNPNTVLSITDKDVMTKCEKCNQKIDIPNIKIIV